MSYKGGLTEKISEFHFVFVISIICRNNSPILSFCLFTPSSLMPDIADAYISNLAMSYYLLQNRTE